MPESEIPLDDRTRFADFLAIFSEKFVASLVRSLAYNGYYPAELNQMFDEYPKSAGAYRQSLIIPGWKMHGSNSTRRSWN